MGWKDGGEYSPFTYSHFAYLRPKSIVSPILNIFTNALIDIQHSSNTIFNSNHHGNRFSFHIIETREFNSCLIHKDHDKPTSGCCHLDIALMLKCEYVPNISRYTCCRMRLTFLSMVPDIGLFSVCPLWF